MTRLLWLILPFLIITKRCSPYVVPHDLTSLTSSAATSPHPRQVAPQMCNDYQIAVIGQVLQSLSNILFMIDDVVSHPLLNNHIGRRFVYHFGRRSPQYQRRAMLRFNAVREECQAQVGRVPIFCYDVEGRCFGQHLPLYLDQTRSFIILVYYLFIEGSSYALTDCHL